MNKETLTKTPSKQIQYKIGVLKSLSSSEHLHNLLKILDFVLWSDNEKVFYLSFYRRMAIDGMLYEDFPEIYTKNIDRLFYLLDYE